MPTLQRQRIPLIDSKVARQRSASGTTSAVALFAPQYNIDGTFARNRDVFVGVGLRSARVGQENSVEPVMSMGHADFVDIAEHGVRDNTVALSKVMMVDSQLAKTGVAAFGMDNLTSVAMSAVVYNSAWAQIDVESGQAAFDKAVDKQLTYVKIIDMHLRSNNLQFQVGTVNTEDVTFLARRFETLAVDDYAFQIFARMQNMFPEYYQNYFGYNSHQKLTESSIYTAS
jgi:hypothetical protein